MGGAPLVASAHSTRGRWKGLRSAARTPRGALLGDALIAVAVVLVVGGPMFFTVDGFSQDFTNALWLIWVAGQHFGHSLWPSYFLSVNEPGNITGVFYPEFAFYGGPLYIASGALSALLGGDATLAYALVTAAAMLGAYGGCVWLARQCGVRGLLAHVPGVVMLTSAYYSTDLYGRGAWAEFIGVSSIPLVVASAVALARAPRWRARTLALFVLSVLVFSGSHNITLEWGVLVLGVLALAMLAVARPRGLPWRRMLAVSVLGLLAAGINGWFLLPDIAYAGKTAVTGGGFDWSYTSFFDTIGIVLNPLRVVPSQSGTPALYSQTPVWFMAWGLLAGVWLWREDGARRLARSWAVLVGMIVLLLWLMLYEWPWQQMPHVLQEIQFPYRLSSYVTLVVSGLVIVGALALQRMRSRPGASVGALWMLRTWLVEALVVSLIACVWQLWVPNTHQSNFYTDRGQALTPISTLPKTWASAPDYADRSLPLVPADPKRSLNIDARSLNAAGDRTSVELSAPPGPQPILTNILAGPYLVHVSGVRVIGRWGSGNDLVVARLSPGAGKLRISLATATSAPIKLGRLLSAVSLALVVALLAWLALRGRGERRLHPVTT